MSASTEIVDFRYTPVPDEIVANDLSVTGTIPPELSGRYLRNGPNPLPGQRIPHGFLGDGMLHGVRLRDGRAEWYRNRWVRTAKLDGGQRRRPDGTWDLAVNNANTSVIRHADKILALCEAGLPYQVTPELDTVGPVDFHGRLHTAMTAHPKEDPVTGDLLMFGYGTRPPYLTYHRLTAAGELVESREIAVPGSTMMHDFAITEHHVVWLDLPVVFRQDLVGKTMPYQWDDHYGARIGVMPRTGDGAVTWFDVDPCYVFHVGNAHEDAAGRITLDAVRYAPGDFLDLWGTIGGAADPATAAARQGGARLHRWTLDPATGTRTESTLDDHSVEFPTVHDGHVGHPNRYLYTVTESEIVKHDTNDGTARTHRLDPGRAPGEAVFVPAADGTAEDHGWLLSLVSDHTEAAADMLLLDAADLTVTATIHLPRRVPAGFHGSWLPDESG